MIRRPVGETTKREVTAYVEACTTSASADGLMCTCPGVFSHRKRLDYHNRIDDGQIDLQPPSPNVGFPSRTFSSHGTVTLYHTEVFRHREARIPRHAGLLGTIDTRPVQSRKQPYDGAAFSGIRRYGPLHVRPRILAWLTLPVSQLTTIFIDASSDLQLVLVLLTACPCSTSGLVCDLYFR